MVAALLAERPPAVATTVAAIAVLAVTARLSGRLWRWTTATFLAHRTAALAGAAVLALALPVLLRASPYWTFVATMALLYLAYFDADAVDRVIARLQGIAPAGPGQPDP